MQAVLSVNHFGHATFNIAGKVAYNIAAFSGTTNPDHTPIQGLQVTTAFVVSDDSGFFNQYVNGDQARQFLIGKRNYQGGSLRAQATILIHETAHQITVDGFQDDFGDDAAEDSNNKAVDKNCRQLIEGLQ